MEWVKSRLHKFPSLQNLGSDALLATLQAEDTFRLR